MSISYVGFIVEKETCHTHICVHVCMSLCICTNYQRTENSLPLHLPIPLYLKGTQIRLIVNADLSVAQTVE